MSWYRSEFYKPKIAFAICDQRSLKFSHAWFLSTCMDFTGLSLAWHHARYVNNKKCRRWLWVTQRPLKINNRNDKIDLENSKILLIEFVDAFAPYRDGLFAIRKNRINAKQQTERWDKLYCDAIVLSIVLHSINLTFY